MELSSTAEYALRAMAFLATWSEPRPARAPDLARATGIPRAYLSKVMRKLVVAGLVGSQKGHGGGFTLARATDAIRFADVLEAAGYEVGADRCGFGWGRCNPTESCPLHPAWSELNRMFVTWAERTTLADVEQNPRLLHGWTTRAPRPRRAARGRLAGARVASVTPIEKARTLPAASNGVGHRLHLALPLVAE
jgi:Rrf2 family protein